MAINLAIAQTAPAVSTNAAPAGADSATASGNSTENIVVTGSRLKTSNATSESPVVEITAAQIAHTQAQTLEDVLTKLPEVGTSGLYNTTNNGGSGVSCIDLRNLGVERTLVLVDGKRFVNTLSANANCVDLNNIPLEQVERIEILKDGASTTYGADAIAGVVNIILKHNFSGVTVHANGQIGTEAGDDKAGELSVLAGTNFDKGNFTVGLDYLNQGPVSQADRPWAQYPVQSDNPLGHKQTVGSIYNPNGLFFADTNNTNPATLQLENVINKNGTIGDTYTGAPSQRFNFGALQQLADSLEKESITTTGNYDFNEHISGFLEGFYTHKRTQEQLAPQPVSASLPLPGSTLPDAFVVPEGNPGLTQLLGPGSGPVDLYKRETQFGDRQYNQVDNTFQINVGLKGDIGAGWNYEVFFQYGEDDDQSTNSNNINFLHLENEVGFQQTTATPAQQAAIIASNGAFDPTTFGVYNPALCAPAGGCANPFGQNMTPAQIKYATYTEAQQNRYTLKTYGGNISNNELFQLPFGPLGVSLGVEHRTESGQFTPDSLDLTGEGLGSTAAPTKGAFDVTEIFGETRIPILKDLPGVKDLHVDVGGRFFSYNTFGDGETWKVAGNYTPITGIRFRGSDGVAFRQPSINDLYTGQLVSFNGANDPCAQVSSYGAKAGIVQANCAKQNINTATFQQAGSQVQAIVGGNPALQPETARTQTAGVVLNPPFVPRLALTADFSRTKINSSIGNLPAQFILDNCYTQTNFNPGSTNAADPCSLVSNRTGTGQLNTITQINENLGVTRTEALDLGGTYSYPTPFGTFSFQNDLTITLKYQEQNVPNGPFIGYLGTIGRVAPIQAAYPRFRDNANVDWRLGNIEFGYTMRYIGGTVFDDYPAPYVQGSAKGQHASAATPDVFYHDINGSYDYHNFTLNFGIQNLFDKQPPYVNDTATNTDAQVYDIFGRVVYLKTTMRF